MNLARSTLQVFTANSLSKLLGLLGVIYFAQELGSGQLGVFFLFQALLGLLAIPADVGLSQGVAKRLSEGENEDEVVVTALLLKLFPAGILAAMIWVLRNPINAYLETELAAFLIIALFVQEGATLTMQILRGQMRVGTTAFPTLARQLTFVCLGVVLVSLMGRVEGIIYALIAGFVVMILVGTFLSRPRIGYPSLDRGRSIVSFSKYAFVSSVGGYFYQWMDVIVVGYVLSTAEVGVYEVSWRVTTVVMLFSQAIATSVFPQVSQWSAEDASGKIEALLPETIALSLLLVVPAFVGTVLFAEELLGLVFGEEFTAGALVLVILMAEKLLQSVHLVLGRALQGIDYPDLAARAGVIAMALNLVLNVVLVLQYGIVGAAVATVLSFAVNSILHATYLSRFLHVRLPLRHIGGIVASAGGMGIVLWIVSRIYDISSIVNLAVVVGLGAALYFGFVALDPSLRKLLLKYAKQTFQ